MQARESGGSEGKCAVKFLEIYFINAHDFRIDTAIVRRFCLHATQGPPQCLPQSSAVSLHLCTTPASHSMPCVAAWVVRRIWWVLKPRAEWEESFEDVSIRTFPHHLGRTLSIFVTLLRLKRFLEYSCKSNGFLQSTPQPLCWCVMLTKLAHGQN
jgi:hypothetical protein